MKLPPNDLGSMKLQLVQFVYRSVWIPGGMKCMHCRDAAIKHRNRVPLIRSAALRSWLTQRDPDEGTRTQTWKRLTLCSNPGTMGTFIYFSDSNGSAEKYPNARDAPTLEGSTGKSSPSARSLVSLMPAIQDGRVHLSRDVSFLIRAFHRLVHQSVGNDHRPKNPDVATGSCSGHRLQYMYPGKDEYTKDSHPRAPSESK